MTKVTQCEISGKIIFLTIEKVSSMAARGSPPSQARSQTSNAFTQATAELHAKQLTFSDYVYFIA